MCHSIPRARALVHISVSFSSLFVRSAFFIKLAVCNLHLAFFDYTAVAAATSRASNDPSRFDKVISGATIGRSRSVQDETP